MLGCVPGAVLPDVGAGARLLVTRHSTDGASVTDVHGDNVSHPDFRKMTFILV